MKHIYLIILMALSYSMTAQFDQLSYGPNYANQVFYDLETGDTLEVAHDTYDIYVSTAPGSAAIYINEGVSSSMTPSTSDLALYLTSATDFSQIDTSGMQRLYNDDSTENQGAFNRQANPNDPFDLGWGIYDPINHQVIGDRIFVVRLRNGTYHKLRIVSLQRGIFTLETAPLGTNNIQEIRFAKSDFSGPYAFVSLQNNEINDFAALDWDLWFTRYATPLDDGSGQELQYVVSGVLLHPGNAAVLADGIDPETVDWRDYERDLSGQPDVIGYDWKEFDLSNFRWNLPEDRVYFIQTRENAIWKLQFVDFEGSSTGVVTFRSEEVGMTSSSTVPGDREQDLTLFPNPVTKDGFSLQSNIQITHLQIEIFSQNGHRLERQSTSFSAGETQRFRSPNSAGTYYLRWQRGTSSGVIPFLVP
jgi:hypothetical protein